MNDNRRSLRSSRPMQVSHGESDISSRGSFRVDGEGVNSPGVPGSLAYPNGSLYAPAELEALKVLRETFPQLKGERTLQAIQALVAGAIQQALDKFSVWSQPKPFTNFDVQPIPLLANVVAQIDPPNQQVNRRILFLINPDPANAVWVNKNTGVAANNGIPVPANNGSYMVAMTEYIQHFALCVGNNTLISVWYT
jgi:hypothetical protein